MSGPDEPEYPDPQYPQYPEYPQQPRPTPRGPGFGARLAERAARRPEPRFGVALAGAGIGLMIAGILVWGGDYVSSGSGGASNGGGSHRALGVVLSLAVVVAGYAVAIRAQRGPLATAGVVAGALGVPVLLGFLTLGSGSGGLPLSFDAVVLVSVAVWILSYVAVPGARGHAFLLALSAVLFWIYLLDKVEPKVFGVAFLAPQLSVLDGSGFDAPDFTSAGSMSLVLGLAYFAVAYGLDRSGRAGTATAFVVGGLPAIDVGVALLAPDLEQVGTGVVTIVLGVILGGYGARYGRRLTAWVSASAAAFGILLIIVKIVGDNAAGGGIALILVGALVVAGGVAWTRLLREPDDMTPRPAPSQV